VRFLAAVLMQFASTAWADAAALCDEGKRLHAAGNLEAALSQFDECVRLHPRNVECHYFRGVVLEGLGIEREQDAIGAFRQVRHLDPTYRPQEVWERESRIFEQIRTRRDARTAWNKFLRGRRHSTTGIPLGVWAIFVGGGLLLAFVVFRMRR
jgi:tetratricopeptide (TPR) repeat protein